MTPERWQRVEELFHSALAREPGQWATFLAQACVGDEPLLREVESLISFHERRDSFIETPASDLAAELLARRPGDLEAGQQIAYFKILSSLGAGGMGEVYLAEDTRLGRRIALKLLPAQFTTDAERVHRFEQEARAASALNHPNIVTIHEIGREGATHFIATEFIDGETLREHCSGRAVNLNEALDIAIQIASALEAAHAAGIVHRDIKPENVMLRRDRIVKVLDFGLAKLEFPETAPDGKSATRSMVDTNPGMVMGTVQYMSPEQARGQDVNGGTDIWSLGVLLYEMVTGRAPFRGETRSHVVVSILESDPPLLALDSEVPEELQRIVSKALRKDREERYQTASGLATDLKNLRQELEADARWLRSLDTVDKRSVSATKSDGQATPYTGEPSATRPGEIEIAKPTSRALYVVGGIKRRKSGVTLVAAASLIAIAAITYFNLTRNGAPGSGLEAIDSVAVLPFVNASGDPKTEYLADGISDSIINSLSRLPNLKVISLSKVLRYKGQQVDPQAVGHSLNVRAVLTGRLTQQEDGLAISVELVDVRDSRRLWGEQYSRKLAGILVVQEEIARQISDALRLRLTGKEKTLLAKQHTQNPDAFLLYSMGNYFYRLNTKDAFEKSIESFEQAIKLDPNYALAYAGLARTYQFMMSRGFSPPKDNEQKAEWASLKALQLDDTLAEAHSSLAVYKITSFDWVAAEKESKRALELDPNSHLANTAVAQYLTGIGRADEALPYRMRAQELDSMANPSEPAFFYFLARQYDQAIELYLQNIEKKPDIAHTHILLGEAYVANGMPAEGVAETQKGVALDATLDRTPERWDRYPMLAYACASAGRHEEALKILGDQQNLAKQRYVSPFNFAIIYTGLGDKDQAFAWLAKAVEERTRLLTQLKSRPLFDPLRSDPRYVELLRKMNLAP
jgi:serine/threonine-protein kinase